MKETKSYKPFLLGLLLGMFGLTFVAFSAGWVVTSGYADDQAALAAEEQLVDRLASICVAQFQSEAQPGDDLAELKSASYLERSEVIEENGWATMPDEKKPDDEVAEACAVEILRLTS